MSDYTAPHCDSSVLHSRGECRFCDEHPDWQELRQMWGIAFTGHEPEPLYEGGPMQTPCPSDQRRGTGQAHTWGGNRPTNVDVPQQETVASHVMYGTELKAAAAAVVKREAERAVDPTLLVHPNQMRELLRLPRDEDDQQLPVPNDGPAIQDLVVADIEVRKQIGIRRYGSVLQANNGRDAILDAYQEAMDLTIYLRQLIEERTTS